MNNKKTSLIKLDTPEMVNIERSKAEQIKATFEPMANMLSEFENHYNGIITEAEIRITKEIMSKAKRLRLDISKIRIKTEKMRKSQKEEYLRAGKAIDGVSNILKWAVVAKEEKLKEIEDYYVIKEKKRLEELQIERANNLSAYVEDAHERNLADMEEDVWIAYLQAKKNEYDDRIEAEKLAEKARQKKEKEEAQKRKRIEKENELLKEEREKLEEEIRKKHEEELRIEQEAEENRQLELNKGDSDKINDLISEIEDIRTKYSFDSDKNKKMYSYINDLFEKIINHINDIENFDLF